MQFSVATISAILAFTSFASAAPSRRGYAPELSLTAQLQLADTAVDRFALLKDDQFVFDFNQQQPNPGKGGQLVAANRKTFPALVGTGAGMAFGRVDACGMNTLHVHPRSAELQIVTSGRLITEMVPENGVNNADGTRRVIRTELGPNMMTPFYQGSVHTQFNPDCHPATFVAAFASEDFGAGQVQDETFALSDDVIAATFGQSIAGEDIDLVRQAIPKSIALGVDECLKKCGITKRAI
ncbi:RmlC-like cupin domain-containing protein [Ilyonectria robusta]|uniref:RmlC-like cupin domain-containing protein n=1 Tax=Ilyonectria robusta TaxID=1079257 RepID=UPI001E8E76D3|nr:RmlC-like cupin domain-containing protein [Ilyonectria robusta]KAH8736142.1 RmlC-like cupin domain-containing protein [Ilyonectria robusta]